MEAYFAADAILAVVWLAFFFKRPDLRKEMIISSFALLLAGFADYYSRSTYWLPPTLMSIPIGIEGLFLGFVLGGIGSVTYEVFLGKYLKKFRVKSGASVDHWLAPASVAIVSLSLFFVLGMNMMPALLIALIVGIGLIALMRPDLRASLVFSSLSFGILYFILFVFWLKLFPEAINWWRLDVFGGIKIASVPLGEFLFGFLYGGFYGPLYEFLFGYRLIEKKG